MDQKECVTRDPSLTLSPLSASQKWLFAVLAWALVAFGQPSWHWFIGLIASVTGYAIFFRVLLSALKNSHRFWLATGWFTAVQITQLSWMISHPYSYIYGVLLILSFLVGLQFGLLGLLIKRRALDSLLTLAGIASLWTIMEWSRLFFLSGFSWNPVGLALTGAIYPLQLASLWGVFGLSFWVIWVNLLALRAWMLPTNSIEPTLLFLCCALFPYAYGAVHYSFHERALESYPVKPLSVVLVQPSFPIEEVLNFRDAEELRAYVIAEWRQILSIMRKQLGKQLDLIVLPEYVVPFGTYYSIFTEHEVHAALKEELGVTDFSKLPPIKKPLGGVFETSNGIMPLVSNAFWVQTLANLFDADVVVGLEDVVDFADNGKQECYNAALYFRPNQSEVKRYEKRILVPMGEYIPLDVCRKIAAKYGVNSSFTCGKEAKVFQGKVPFSSSICYEETFGALMTEGRAKGAELLVNITSDAWYPNSRLPQQHFDHARLRTVENGIPLVRACNTGVTGAVDSLGRIIGVLDDGEKPVEWRSDSIHLYVPTYHYFTLYSRWGDKLILSLCSALGVAALIAARRRS